MHVHVCADMAMLDDAVDRYESVNELVHNFISTLKTVVSLLHENATINTEKVSKVIWFT